MYLGIKMVALALCLFTARFAMGQTVPAQITNSDVINMTKAGIGEQTVVLAIQRGPVKFDTSPQALIQLKGAGVSDHVLDAILAAANDRGAANSEASNAAAQDLFQKALTGIGPPDKIAEIHSYRWKGSVLQSAQGGTRSFERETVRVYPDSAYLSMKSPAGALQREVMTPEFNYRTAGSAVIAIPPPDLESLREQLSFEILYVAQHAEEYAVAPALGKPNEIAGVERLRISRAGKEVVWEIDSRNGRLLSVTQPLPAGDVVTEYSDWRLIDGVYFSFKRHQTASTGITDFTIEEYEINPVVSSDLFKRPTQTPAQGLTLKVLQEQSVPYVQESGGGISTSCNIVGSANTSAYVNSYGTSAYGNATTNSTQHMSCNSYDTTMRWPHVLNVMFAQASDGNSYIIACDRAWRWSKCVPLRAGDIFNARFTDKGIEVEATSTKGKEENPTYHVLQSKSSR